MNLLQSGSLAVPHGRSIIPVVNQLASYSKWSLVLASKDWHPANHTSFACNHAGAKPFDSLTFQHPLDPAQPSRKETVWPTHCVQGSSGAEFPSDFDTTHVSKIVEKGFLVDREYYSAFTDIWGIHKTEIEQYLREKNVNTVVIVGLAFDYCVLNTALDSAKAGFETYVVREGTKPVNEEAWDATELKLKNGGVSIIGIDNEILKEMK